MASDITADKGRVAEVKADNLIDKIDAYQDTEVRNVITRKDLWKCAFRGLFMEGNFNFERMQGEDLHTPLSPHYRRSTVITVLIWRNL